MRRLGRMLAGMLFVGFCAAAVELLFEPQPCLLGTFQILVRGELEQTGEVVLLNLTTKEQLVLELYRDGNVLKSRLLQVLRPCDPLTVEGAVPVRVSGVGDHLVAATALGCGLSAVTKVGPRPGAAELVLERKEGEEWRPADGLGAGDYRLRVLYPPADLTCDPDRLPGGLVVRAAENELALELSEVAGSSGSFVWHFSGSFEVDKSSQQLLFVFRWDDQQLKIPAVCTSVVFRAVDQELAVGIQPLQVEIEPGDALLLPVGCRASLKLTQPKEPDEVLWWAVGRWYAGTSLDLVVGEPGAGILAYPAALVLRVFARKGEIWGVRNVAVSVIPRPELAFIDPDTGERILAAWPKEKSVKIQLSQAWGLPPEIALVVGKLGPHPKERSLVLRQVKEGVYESDLLHPGDWQVQAGEYLWAQLCYPGPIECVISVLLLLR